MKKMLPRNLLEVVLARDTFRQVWRLTYCFGWSQKKNCKGEERNTTPKMNELTQKKMPNSTSFFGKKKQDSTKNIPDLVWGSMGADPTTGENRKELTGKGKN
ncbi:MAG: hypothetical protein KIT69_21555 [Propionibacteriaceae bacterium]|nr:hypothetical protein [Propionibacteriaceae bacterium]